MLAAVVPVRNEESRVGGLLARLNSRDFIKHIFVILNGSDKNTRDEVESVYRQAPHKFTLVSFGEPLGIDVPRAVGARLAATAGVPYTLFVDGDLVGEFTAELRKLAEKTIENRLDLSLVDCYPHGRAEELLSQPMFFFRRLLNKELGLVDRVGIATPSHGPHIVSRRLLSCVPWEDFAVPPTLLVHACSNNLRVAVAGAIPHPQLGSSIKNQEHSRRIVDTIAGDCIEAICLFHRLPRSREFAGRVYLGYHGERRFDLLKQFLAGRLLV